MVGSAYITRHPPHVSRVLLRLGGTDLAALLVQELGPAQVAVEPAGIDPARGKHLTGAVLSVLGTGLREAGRGIGRFVAGLSSCGCS